MIFSLFKKRPEKTTAHPATGTGSKETPPPETGRVDDDQEASLADEFSDDFRLTQSSFDLQIDAELDPVDAPAEEAAVLFANDQDRAAQTVLENALGQPPSGPVERLWLMLFDLYRLSGQRPAFEAKGIEYACAFEKSPPAWGGGGEAESAPSAQASKGGSVLFKGDLLGDNVSSFDAARQALGKNGTLRLDVSKVQRIDPKGCACLLDVLLYARRNRHGIDLKGKDALILLVKEAVEAGKKETPAVGKECWFLLLELLQQQGRQEVFEEHAIDYAMTFEESPPSWDAGRVKAPETAAREAVAESDAVSDGDAYVLSGEIESSRFADLPSFAQERDALLIDCAKLTRIDFVSAAGLLNLLTPMRGAGKEIVFRHPNHLVAELFRVVGLTGVATIIFARH